MHGTAVLWLAMALAVGDTSGEETPPPCEVRLHSEDDRVTWRHLPAGSVATIASPRGIGRATLSPAGEAWPAGLVLRLELGDLEGFDLSAAGLRLKSFLGAETTEVIRPAEAAEDLPANEALQLTIRQAEGAIEVELPPALLEWGPAEIEIQWVDWYR